MLSEGARTLAWMLGILSIGLAMFLGYAIGLATAIVTLILAMLGTAVSYKRRMTQARAHCGAECICVGRAMAYLGWHGTLHQFEVLSACFARDFMVANQGKLVNLSAQAQNVLSGAGSTLKTNPRTPRRYQT